MGIVGGGVGVWAWPPSVPTWTLGLTNSNHFTIFLISLTNFRNSKRQKIITDNVIQTTNIPSLWSSMDSTNIKIVKLKIQKRTFPIRLIINFSLIFISEFSF